MSVHMDACPFCGSTDVEVERGNNFGSCNGCGAWGPIWDDSHSSGHDETERHAAELWNRRAGQPAAAEPVLVVGGVSVLGEDDGEVA